MLINAMPILHARTYNLDFRSKLLIRPEIFTDDKASFCYKVATDSTRFREFSSPEGRSVVYGDGKNIVIGKTVVFNDLYKKLKKDNNSESVRYLRVDNEKGRFAYGFVGITFLINEISKPIWVSDEKLLQIYIQFVSERWDETISSKNAFESRLSQPIIVEVEELFCNEAELIYIEEAMKARKNKLVLEDSVENRNNAIYCVFRHALNGETLSLCTSLKTEKAISESCFDIVTCENASAMAAKDVLEQKETNFLAPPQSSKSQSSFWGRKTNNSNDEYREDVSLQIVEDINKKNLSNPFEIISKISNIPNMHGGSLKEKDSSNILFDTSISRRVQSLDDVIRQNTVPASDLKEIVKSMTRYPNKQKNNSVNNFPNYKDVGMVLGTILGTVFIALEITNKPNPVVLAITGVCTFLIAGKEAKRIVDKFTK